jgi:hypothetical protein
VCQSCDQLAVVWYSEIEVHAARVEVRLDSTECCLRWDFEDTLGLKHEIVVIHVSRHIMLLESEFGDGSADPLRMEPAMPFHL